MYKVIILDKKSQCKAEFKFDNSSQQLENNDFGWDIIEIRDGSFHIIKDNKSYKAEVIRADYNEKKFVIRVNGNMFDIEVKDKYDELLDKLGFKKQSSDKIKEVRAPMPGLVLDVMVQEGMKVKAGDTLLVLEAMKMENVIKSPVTGLVKKIHIKTANAVEKDGLLIDFEDIT